MRTETYEEMLLSRSGFLDIEIKILWREMREYEARIAELLTQTRAIFERRDAELAAT